MHADAPCQPIVVVKNRPVLVLVALAWLGGSAPPLLAPGAHCAFARDQRPFVGVRGVLRVMFDVVHPIVLDQFEELAPRLHRVSRMRVCISLRARVESKMVAGDGELQGFEPIAPGTPLNDRLVVVPAHGVEGPGGRSVLVLRDEVEDG